MLSDRGDVTQAHPDLHTSVSSHDTVRLPHRLLQIGEVCSGASLTLPRFTRCRLCTFQRRLQRGCFPLQSRRLCTVRGRVVIAAVRASTVTGGAEGVGRAGCVLRVRVGPNAESDAST